MSTLFGICGLGAALEDDVKPRRLGRMANQARASGSAGTTQNLAQVASGSIALGACGRPGARITAQIAQDGPVWLTFSGRLDYREDLHSTLGLSEPGRSGHGMSGPKTGSWSDAELVLLAFQRFGIGCVEHFCGDWSFAVWDAHSERLHLARDATGISEMYWWSGRQEVQFASSLSVLLATGSMPLRPDPGAVAGLLTVFTDTSRPSATAIQDVHALPPGCLVTFSRQGSNLRRWWHPEDLGRFYAEPMERLREQFLDQYRRSVHALLPADGRGVAATLSGGLDSGSVVALAAPELGRLGQRLSAYVHAPRFSSSTEHPARLGDEWEMALATARHVGNVDAQVCRSESLSPLDGMRQWMDLAVVPSHAVGNFYWLLDIARQAAAGGAQCLLVGQAGNSTVSYNGDGNLWPRLARMQWGIAVRELIGDRSGPLAAFTGRIVKPMLRPAYRAIKVLKARRLEHAAWTDYALVSRELAQETQLLAAMRAARHDPSFGTQHPRQRDLFRLTLRGGPQNGSAIWSELGRSQGLDIGDPTRDRRLVELCWRLPDELFWAQGRQRGLIRGAMESALPAAVVESKVRGQQSSDLRLRLEDCAQDLLAEVDHVRQHPTVRAWIDTERLWRFAQDLAAPATTSPSATDPYLPQHMLRTIAVAKFVAKSN